MYTSPLKGGEVGHPSYETILFQPAHHAPKNLQWARHVLAAKAEEKRTLQLAPAGGCRFQRSRACRSTSRGVPPRSKMFSGTATYRWRYGTLLYCDPHYVRVACEDDYLAS